MSLGDNSISLKSSEPSFPVLDGLQIEHLKKLSIIELESECAKLLGIENYSTHLPEAAVLDFFVSCICFCTESGLSENEAIGFLDLNANLLSNCKNGLSLEENVARFRTWLENNSFDCRDAQSLSKVQDNSLKFKAVIDYVMSSLFQHYNLYVYLFNEKQVEQVLYQERFLEVLPLAEEPFPPPLEESIDVEWYQQSMCPEAVNKPGEIESHTGVAEAVTTEQPDVCPEIVPELTPATAEEILASLDVDVIKSIIKSTAEDKLHAVKAELEAKIKEKEVSLLKNLGKLQVL